MPLKVDDSHLSRCDTLLSELRALYKRGTVAFYAGFAKHLPELKHLYNYRGDYEREQRQCLPPHAVDTVGYLYSTRQKLAHKEWEVDWDAMGRALATKEDNTAVGRARGSKNEPNQDATNRKEREKGKGKGKEKEKERETAKGKDKEMGAGGSGTLAKKDQPRPKPLRREAGGGTANVNGGDAVQERGEAPPPAAAVRVVKPSVKIAAAAPPLPTAPKKTKPRIKSKESVEESEIEPEPVAPIKGKFREKVDEEEEEAREQAQKGGRKAEKGAPRVSGGGGRSRTTTSDSRGGGLADDEEEADDKEEAPLHTARRRNTDKREADAAKRAEEEKEEEAKRVFMVFAKCSMCERLKIPCIWTHSRIHSAREGVKVACDFCKTQKRGCDASGSAALSLNGHLGPYEEELFPGEELDVGGEGADEQRQNKTLGDVFVTMLEEQRNLLFQVGRIGEKVSGLSTGIDTAPQHQEGLAKALKNIINRLEIYDDDRKAWDLEREEFEKERKGWEKEREAWACERKEWEEERKRESHKFAAAVSTLASSIEALKVTHRQTVSPPPPHSGGRPSLSPPLMSPPLRHHFSPPLSTLSPRAALSPARARSTTTTLSLSPPPPRIAPSRARIEDEDEEEASGSEAGQTSFQRSRLSAIDEESAPPSQQGEGVHRVNESGVGQGNDAPLPPPPVEKSPAAEQNKPGEPPAVPMDVGGDKDAPPLGVEEEQAGGGAAAHAAQQPTGGIADTDPLGGSPAAEPIPMTGTTPTEPKRRTRSNSKAQPTSAATAAFASRAPSAQPKKRKQRSSSPPPDQEDPAADPSSKPAKKVKT